MTDDEHFMPVGRRFTSVYRHVYDTNSDDDSQDEVDNVAGTITTNSIVPIAEEVLGTAHPATSSAVIGKKPDYSVSALFRAVKSNQPNKVAKLCRFLKTQRIMLDEVGLREPQTLGGCSTTATVLHTALLYEHNKIAKIICENHPYLVEAEFEDERFRGQTVVHITAANGNADMLESLLSFTKNQSDTINLIHHEASGSYFCKKYPQGQFALTLAAWVGHENVLNILLKHGADPSKENVRGDTVLHIIVRNCNSSSPDMLDQYKRMVKAIWKSDWFCMANNNPLPKSEHKRNRMQLEGMRILLAIRNKDGFTPISLAAKIESPIFLFFLQLGGLYKFTQASWASVAWDTYDVTGVTTFAEGRYDKSSCLHQIVHSSQFLDASLNRMDVFGEEPVASIIACKWSVYCWIYYLWGIIHLVYMTLFSVFTLKYGPAVPKASVVNTTTAVNISRSASVSEESGVSYVFVFFLILPLAYLVFELLDWFSHRPLLYLYRSDTIVRRLWKTVYSEMSLTGNAPFRAIAVLFSLACIAWLVSYIGYFYNHRFQSMALSTTLVLGWIFLIYFTRGLRAMSKFSVMIQKMFFQDMLYFLGIYLIILLAFSSGHYALVLYVDPDSDMNTVFYEMLNTVLDVDDKPTPAKPFSKVLLCLHAIITVVLLLNMLIAMMSSSYEAVNISNYDLSKRQRLSIMLMIERRLFWLKPLCRYSERIVKRIPSQTNDEGMENNKLKQQEMELKGVTTEHPKTESVSRCYIESVHGR